MKMIIAFIIGDIAGFIISSLFSYNKILNKEIEINLLKKQNNKYKDFIDTHQFYDDNFVKKEDDECDL